MSDIERSRQEERDFSPAAACIAGTALSSRPAYDALCVEAARGYEGFWARLARGHLIGSPSAKPPAHRSSPSSH